MASSSVFIDLCTPPGSPTGGAAAAQSSGPIDLCTPPESPKRVPLATVSNTAGGDDLSSKALGKRKAPLLPDDSEDEAGLPLAAKAKTGVGAEEEEEEEEECMEVDGVAHQQQVPHAASADRRDGEDDDLEFVGRVGANALSDFPHARENCVEIPWAAGKEHNACPNCYCYVCDDVASSCPQWHAHCKATHRSPAWRAAREAWKRRPKPAPATAGAGSSSAPPAHSSVAASSSTSGAPGEPRWSAERLLRAIEQVYPEERSEPTGFASGITLRPYQRQSLAFMLNIEESTDHKLQGTQYTYASRKKGGPATHAVRGGWLCDEMGMGKTCVCAALVLSTRSKGQTVVLVNNSLVGQWVDEIQKFAPGLRVCKAYGGGRYSTFADIVITTPHSYPPTGKQHVFRCHRLIIDESHLYEKGADPKMPTSKVMVQPAGVGGYYKPKNLWLVTGTPFSNSLDNLAVQAAMLGHWEHGLNVRTLCQYMQGKPTASIGHAQPLSNEVVADTLKLLLIRHTKSQRIHGEQALSLPDADVETVWLTMSAAERVMYDLYSCADGIPQWADVNRVSDATLSDLNKGLSKRRAALAYHYNAHWESRYGKTPENKQAYDELSNVRGFDVHKKYVVLRQGGSADKERWARLTKFAALKKDLEALQAATPDASVVIFTNHNEVLADVCSMLREMRSLEIFEVSRKTDATKRHRALREFQAGGGQPKAFCTTFGTAAVGLTLTAASRVYLLEASLDPAQEAQAAGRIHRLGQTKEVLVKRFYFRESLDEAVHALHRKLKAGELKIESGRFPRGALQVFRDHGVANPHKRDVRAPRTDAQRRYRSTDERNVAQFGGDGGFDYGKSVQTQPCARCGQACEIPGSSIWWGKGRWASLDGDTADHPALIAAMEPPEHGYNA